MLSATESESESKDGAADTPRLRRRSSRTSRRTETTVDSTAWLAPDRPPRRGHDGKFSRPHGPPPVDGYKWNSIKGVWVPSKGLLQETEVRLCVVQEVRKRPSNKHAGAKRQPSSKHPSRRKKVPRKAVPSSFPVARPDVTSHSDTIDELQLLPQREKPLPPAQASAKTGVDWERQAKRASAVGKTVVSDARNEHSSPQSDSNEDRMSGEGFCEAVEAEAQQETDQVSAPALRDCGTDTSPERQQQQKTPVENKPSLQGPFHPCSQWQEPPPSDDEIELTLYEKHRKPRPAPRGYSKCSIQALSQEFRCVICLDYIRNARIVRECLHRFCEQCIDRALVGRRKECPICRVHIPSRRSLAPDPNFDMLIQSVLGNLVRDHHAAGTIDAVSPNSLQDSATVMPSRILQHAIQQKKLSLERVERETQLQGEDDSSDETARSATSVAAGSPPLTTAEASQRTTAPLTENDSPPKYVPPLVKLVLLRIGEVEFGEDTKMHAQLDDLRQPFLTISGDAPVKVLHSFLRRKFGGVPANTTFVLRSIWQGLPTILADDTVQLQTVVTKMSDHYCGKGFYMPLYYNLKHRPQTASADDTSFDDDDEYDDDDYEESSSAAR